MTGLSSTLAVALLCAGMGLEAASLEQALKHMDQNAATFKSMTANVRWVSYVAVIKEENSSAGTLRMKRAKRDVRVVVEFTTPEPKSVAVVGTKVELYYPKMKTVEEHNLGGR